jgi:hypothetical protein
MDVHDAGKKKVEQFAWDIVKSLKLDGQVDAFLWWLASPPEPAGAIEATGAADGTGDPPVVMRMYKGNSWRSVEFAASDIDGSTEKPELLKKYEGEITESLLEL